MTNAIRNNMTQRIGLTANPNDRYISDAYKDDKNVA